MKCKITLNKMRVKQLQRSHIVALEKTAEAVMTDVKNAQVVPFDKGDLQDSIFVYDQDKSKGHVEIVADTPYARRLYFHPEYNFSKEEHAEAKGKWFDDWIDGDKAKFAQTAFNKFYKQEAGL